MLDKHVITLKLTANGRINARSVARLIEAAANVEEGKRHARGKVSASDVKAFVAGFNKLADIGKVQAFRQYSSTGFVPNSYQGAMIGYVEGQFSEDRKELKVIVGQTGASRSNGNGPSATVNGRRSAHEWNAAAKGNRPLSAADRRTIREHYEALGTRYRITAAGEVHYRGIGDGEEMWLFASHDAASYASELRTKAAFHADAR